jgi:hypothetical protein
MATSRFGRISCFAYIPRVGLLKLVLERRGLRTSRHDLPPVDREKLVHSRTSCRDFLRRYHRRRLQLPRDQETEPIEGADAVGADQFTVGLVFIFIHETTRYSELMKAYVLVTGIVFALIVIAHILRIAAEGVHLVTEPSFALTSLLSIALFLWAALLYRKILRSQSGA